MSTTLKKSIAGIAVLGFLALGFVTPAKAATIEELQALIADLTAQLAALSGGSSATSCTTYGVSAVVRQGMNGANVVAVQRAVNHTGAATLATDGAFGPATKAGVMAAQVKLGATADGVWGPNTQAKYQAWVTNTCDDSEGGSPTPGSTGGLNGGTGDITVDNISSYSNEDVGEGEDDVVVLGIDIEAGDDSDVRINSVKVEFLQNNATASDKLDDYADEVSVWFKGDKVGSADADDFSENNDVYSKNITLDSDVVIDADEEEELLVAVTALNNLDSTDFNNDQWNVAITQIRFTDGDGVVTTNSYTVDLTDGLADEPTNMITEAIFDFVDFGTSADVELKLRSASDNPEEGVVVVSDSGSTDGVLLLKGELEAEGSSDLWIDEFPVTFSPTGSNFNVIVESISIIIDGEEYTESVPSIAAGASATVTFDDLDFTLDAGDEVDFEVVAEIADIDDFTAGDTVEASVTQSNRSAIDVEDEAGDQLASGERSGTIGGDAQEFREEGIMVELVSATATKSSSDTNNGDTGTFDIVFDVTAIGSNVYISSVASTAGAANNTYSVDISGTASTAGLSAAFVNNTDSDLSSNGLYEIEETETERFTMTILRTINEDGDDGLYRAALTGIKWDTDDDTTPDQTYTTDLDGFKTGYIGLD